MDEEKEILRGLVTNWKTDRGFGFISPDDGSDTVFVHYSVIEGTGKKNLHKNDYVEFEAIPDEGNPGKRKAKTCKILRLANPAIPA